MINYYSLWLHHELLVFTTADFRRSTVQSTAVSHNRKVTFSDPDTYTWKSKGEDKKHCCTQRKPCTVPTLHTQLKVSKVQGNIFLNGRNVKIAINPRSKAQAALDNNKNNKEKRTREPQQHGHGWLNTPPLSLCAGSGNHWGQQHGPGKFSDLVFFTLKPSLWSVPRHLITRPGRAELDDTEGLNDGKHDGKQRHNLTRVFWTVFCVTPMSMWTNGKTRAFDKGEFVCRLLNLLKAYSIRQPHRVTSGLFWQRSCSTSKSRQATTEGTLFFFFF